MRHPGPIVSIYDLLGFLGAHPLLVLVTRLQRIGRFAAIVRGPKEDPLSLLDIYSLASLKIEFPSTFSKV